MFYKGRFFLPGWAYFLVMFGLAPVLPEWMGVENGVIENIQMLWLFAAFWLCIRALSRPLLDWGGSKKALLGAGMIYYFLVIMREISWGRAFFPRPDGSHMSYSEIGLSATLVHSIVGVLIVLLLIFAFRGKIWKFLQRVKVPVPDFLLLVLFIAFADIGEHRNIFLFHGEVAEELAEFGAYMMMWKLTRDALGRAEKK